jgi:anti-sigma factor RsiW
MNRISECSEVQPLLSAFHDGELEPAEMVAVAHHTAQCAECEAAMLAYGAIGERLRLASNVEVPEWFAASVIERIDQLQPSLFARMGHYFRNLNERIGAGFSLAAAGLVAAALTAIVLTPYVRRIGKPQPASEVVASAERADLPQANELAQNTAAALPVDTADSRTLISRLEAKNPAVAVWSEPRTDTTVIWLPDRQR